MKRFVVLSIFSLFACAQKPSDAVDASLTASASQSRPIFASLQLLNQFIENVWVPSPNRTLNQRLQAINQYVTADAQIASLAATPLAPGVPAQAVLAAILQSVVAMDPSTIIRADPNREPQVWVLADGTTRVTSWTIIYGINKNGFNVANFGFVAGNNKPFAVEQQFTYSVAFPSGGAPVFTGLVGDTDYYQFLEQLGAIP